MSTVDEVFVVAVLKERTLVHAMQVGTWQLWSSYEELRI